jgi:hypothetical protein
MNSVDDAAKALAKIDSPIGTLYFVTHSTSDGALKFGKDEGFTKAADIAAKLKGSVPDKVPDRGFPRMQRRQQPACYGRHPNHARSVSEK